MFLWEGEKGSRNHMPPSEKLMKTDAHLHPRTECDANAVASFLFIYLFFQQSSEADIQNAWTIYIQYISHMSHVCWSQFNKKKKKELTIC